MMNQKMRPTRTVGSSTINQLSQRLSTPQGYAVRLDNARPVPVSTGPITVWLGVDQPDGPADDQVQAEAAHENPQDDAVLGWRHWLLAVARVGHPSLTSPAGTGWSRGCRAR